MSFDYIGGKQVGKTAVRYFYLLAFIAMSFILASPLSASPILDVEFPITGSSIVYSDSIVGSVVADDPIDRVELAIKDRNTGYFWDGLKFSVTYTRVLAELSGSGTSVQWAYNQLPIDPTQMAYSAFVWDINGLRAGPVSGWFNLTNTTIDTTSPTVDFANILAGDRFSHPVVLAGNVIDDVSVDRVEITIRDMETNSYWNGVEFQSSYVRNDTSLVSASQWETINFPSKEGSYAVSAWSWDSAGNVAGPESTWVESSNSLADTTLPMMTFGSQDVPNDVPGATFSLSGVATDNVAVDRVELAIRDRETNYFWNGSQFQNSYHRVLADLSVVGNESVAWSYSTLQLLDGSYAVSGFVLDTSLNLAGPQAFLLDIVAGNGDTQIPVVDFDSGSDILVFPDTNIGGTVADDVAIDRVSLAIRDEETNQFWNGNEFQNTYVRVATVLDGSDTSANWVYTNMPKASGDYSLAAWAWDKTGKVSVSSQISLELLNAVAPAGVDLEKYELVFNDEFTNLYLDGEKWNTALYWGPYVRINGEEQLYVDTLGLNSDSSHTPFEFSGDTLTINAEKVEGNISAPNQPAENADIWQTDPDKRFNADYRPSEVQYVSGIITSSDSFNFTHGYAEARVRLPVGAGLWPAFWLLNTKYVEDAPEIDIMEYLGHTDDRIYQTYHYFKTQENWEKVSTPTFEVSVDGLTEQFHTFGLSWEADQLVWYVDGVETQRISNATFDIANQAMYVIANLAVGGSWPGSPTAETPFPAQYEIDYIRVYKKKPVTPVTQAVLDDHYKLVFSDEFNGDSLDITKWNTSYLWGPYFRINREEQVYIDSAGQHGDSLLNPFSLSNGTLKISAKAASLDSLPVQPPINDPIWAAIPEQQYNGDYRQADGWLPEYSSGLITSYDSFKFVQGYVEMRAKLPSGPGLWPAFWLLNGYYVGPQPEIDIMEQRGSEPSEVHHSYHFNDINGQLTSSAEVFSLSNGQSFSDDFHTFGVEWGRGVIKWYVDGQVTRTLITDDVSEQVMYIIANLAVGGNFVGPVSAESVPAQFEIDYIRAYQRKPTS